MKRLTVLFLAFSIGLLGIVVDSVHDSHADAGYSGIATLMAQNSKGARVDPTELDYETNLTVPAIPAKQADAIRKHLDAIQEALNRLSFTTQRSRNNEVVTVVIPCSEMFAPNDTVLKGSAEGRLEHFVKFLKYPTMYKLIVAVHTDNTGEPQYCDWLSEMRANAIDECLINLAHQNGIHNINVIPYGMGQAAPREENSSIQNRAANRRVEIHIIPEWQMIETARAGKLK